MATATTATAEGTSPVTPHGAYVGRFAPSPTGRLHLGSLTTALGSCLEARAHGGRWLLRIEDLDTPRILPGAADEMLRTLEALGFEWDGAVVYQSQRAEAHATALARLRDLGRLYPCGCSRRQLSAQDVAADTEGGYPGTCRHGTRAPPPWAHRFLVRDDCVQVLTDGLCGEQRWPMHALGDPVVQRRDGIVAYQLAVVVDDDAASVTDVVRGADLLTSTAWQRELQQALGLPLPRCVHLPLVTAPDGSKLSKTASAVPLDPASAGEWLHRALLILRQTPPTSLHAAKPREIWQWAESTWNLNALRSHPTAHETL